MEQSLKQLLKLEKLMERHNIEYIQFYVDESIFDSHVHPELKERTPSGKFRLVKTKMSQVIDEFSQDFKDKLNVKIRIESKIADESAKITAILLIDDHNCIYGIKATIPHIELLLNLK